MFVRRRILPLYKFFCAVILLALLASFFGAGNLSSAAAQKSSENIPEIEMSADVIISDGQFVYGPNISGFDLQAYLQKSAPHLAGYAEELSGLAVYFSINPKVYLALLELKSNLISNPDPDLIEDPFGLGNGGFGPQIEYISNKMIEAYYLHLYTYSNQPILQRNLKAFSTPAGNTINVAQDVNAGTYAIIAGLAAIDQLEIPTILDNNQAAGFNQTFRRLFENDNPLDDSNHIDVPGELGAEAAPAQLLQVPYLRGLSWRFGGVHNTSGASDFTDASSLDFYPWPIAWGDDTSNMWVVASAAGTPTRLSACGFLILHADGWETFYYHLENTQYLTGFVNQNDKIGVIANTFAEATCTGGNSTGPHVHFSLRHNGAFVAINGTALSGWYVHSGRYSYDTDPNYMWLERSGIKKYAYSNTLLSEIVVSHPHVTSITRANPNPTTASSVKFTVTFTEPVTGVDAADFSISQVGISGAKIMSVSAESGATRTVTANTGSGIGTLKLNVVDNDSIRNLGGVRLGGTGAGNGSFTTGQKYTLDRNNQFYSIGPQDGWILESSENSSLGGSALATGSLRVGDNSANRQYRSILSFNTSSLPDNASIVRVTLKIRRAGLVGIDPFGTHGLLLADIRKGFFGSTASLQVSDFQVMTTPLKSSLSPFSTLDSSQYQLVLGAANAAYVNKIGMTQFRLGFAVGDNDNYSADYVTFYGGETTAYRPVLIVEYTLP